MHSAKRNISVVGYKSDIIIPAAGLGTRMRKHVPKAMLQINGEKIVNRSIDLLHRKRHIDNIYVVYGAYREYFFKHKSKNCISIFNKDFEHDNVVGSLQRGLRLSKANSIYIVYGDLMYEKSILDDFRFNESTILTQTSPTMGDQEVGCFIEDNKLKRLMWGLDQKWCHILYLTGKELYLAKKIISDKITHKWFGFELINEIIFNGGQITNKTIKQKIIDIDNIKDFKRAEELFK